MHITGIIAEYNPLHKGHKFHIAKTKSMTNADYLITVLSGDFVQRGIPALMDKHTRTKMALEAGSDLVIELPTAYALSSGEGFGFGGISILDQLGCVDTVSFGTETGELSTLTTIAKLLSEETPIYKQAYQTALKNGISHPAARVYALKETYPELDTSILDGASNNMLALEYCKALYRLNSSITPVTIKREGQNYLEQDISNLGAEEASLNFSSAAAIRNALLKSCQNAGADVDEIFAKLETTLSHNVRVALKDACKANKLLYLDDFSSILHYKLLSLNLETLLTYREVTESFARKILKHKNAFTSFTQFANLLWTKDTTYAKVCRTLMYILLGFKKDAWDVHNSVPYARILGFRKDASSLLAEIKKTSSIPLISKLADADKLLGKEALQLLDLDIKAAHIYDSVCLHKTAHSMTESNSESTIKNEMQKQILIL